MSRAKRTVRTTAAAAGIAALGVGIAGPALAAPGGPEDVPTPGPALPELSGLPVQNPLAALPAPPSVPTLPMLFVFEAPRVNAPAMRTAGPSTSRPQSATPVRTELAADTGTDATSDATSDEADPAPSTPGLGQVAALSALDTARLFDGSTPTSLVQQRGLGTSSLGLG
jgi:hypothetical protein